MLELELDKAQATLEGGSWKPGASCCSTPGSMPITVASVSRELARVSLASINSASAWSSRAAVSSMSVRVPSPRWNKCWFCWNKLFVS